MSKYEKGQTVWVKGEYHIDDNGSHWVRIKCHYAIRDQGECNVKVPSKYLKPQRTQSTTRTGRWTRTNHGRGCTLGFAM